ncbi:MAG: c-type cytochrome [Chloroflexi bacterium]|nr:c-type cytochrome [Chloroflexota bacterium]
MRKILFVSVIALVCLLAAGVGVALAQTGDPKRGAELYAANCAVCHGADAQGRIGATLSKDFSSINEAAFLQETISNGIEGTRMPAWSEANGGPLSDQDIADIAAYVAGLLGGSEPIAPAPTAAVAAITPAAGVTGDPSAGAVVFAQNCAACHGERGEGRIGAKLTKSWPALNPSAYVRETVEKGIDGTLMPAWLDENGGPLTKADIDNVSAFIVSVSAGQGSSATVTPTVATGPLSAAAGWIILAVVVVLIGVVVVVYYRRA